MLSNKVSEKHWWKYVGALVFMVALGYMWWTSDENQLVCVLSSKDGRRYCIRERKRVKEAADLLAQATANMERMVAYMQQAHPDDPRTRRLVERFRPDKISETLPTSELTAYSENKGEKLAFCLNRKNTGNDGGDGGKGRRGNGEKEEEEENRLIDLHTLTFVALHELSHLMTESVGHDQQFWQNFKFLLQNAKAAGIHDPHDYKQRPREYCGLRIDDSPYYDLV